MTAAPDFDRLQAVGETHTPGPDTLVAPALGTGRWVSLETVLANGEAMEPAPVVVPRLAWKGRTTLFTGREKSGKSTLAAAAAAAVSQGKEFFEEDTSPGLVLWCRLEEHIGDAARNLAGFGADPGRIILSDILQTPVADIVGAMRELRPVLVVVDTLPALGALEGVTDAGQAAPWLEILNPIIAGCRETNAAALILHHASKATEEPRDSSGIGAAVDSIAMMKLDPGNPYRRKMDCRKSRLPVEPVWSFVWDGDGLFDLDGDSVPLPIALIQYARRNPGCSKNALFKACGDGLGKAAVFEQVDRLVDAGELVDRGDATRSAFHWVEP